MADKFFKEKLFKLPSKKIGEIEQIINSTNSPLKKLFVSENLFDLSLFFTFICFCLIGLKFNKLPEKIPLYYSRPWGEEQLSLKVFIFLVPGLSFIFSLTNFIITKLFLKNEHNFILVMLNFFSFLFSFMGLITVTKIIYLML